jgi:hypothetical protein
VSPFSYQHRVRHPEHSKNYSRRQGSFKYEVCAGLERLDLVSGRTQNGKRHYALVRGQLAYCPKQLGTFILNQEIYQNTLVLGVTKFSDRRVAAIACINVNF